MDTSQRFSKEFKETIVKKLLNRGNQTIAEFCNANNIARSTVTTWQTNCANVSEMKNKSLRQIKGLFDHDLKYPRPAPGDFL